jgi:hypothetical protein
MAWIRLPRRPLDTVISSQKFPSLGIILCGSRAERGTWIRKWREVHADLDAFLPMLPRTPHYLPQYRSVVDRYDAGDPEILGLGGIHQHVAAFREILAEAEP